MDYCNEIEYNVMDSESRHLDYETDHVKYCDDDELQSTQSPDWSGPGWYRMEYPAGAMIPENTVEPDHCGTSSSGWLNGEHPETLGQTVERKVCFSSAIDDDLCYKEATIQVRNCGSFFLYYLPNTPGCYLRYCGE